MSRAVAADQVKSLIHFPDILALGLYIVGGFALWRGQGEAVALLIILVAVVGAAISPAGAYMATCAAIPLVFQPVTIGTRQFSLLELAIVSGSVGLALRLGVGSLKRRQSAEIRRLFTPLPTTLLAAALIGLGLLSLAAVENSYNLDQSLRVLRWTVLEPACVLLIARYVREHRGETILAVALLIPAVVVSLHAVWQTVVGDGGFAVDSTFRAVGPYLHPNNLALYLERPLLLLLALVIAGSTRDRRWAVPVAAILLVGIAATLSRGALLGLGVGFLATLVMLRVRRAGTLTLVAGILAIAGFSLISIERLVGATSSGIVSGRLPLWEAALAMVRDHPFRGIGLDQFLLMHRTRYISPEHWSERYVSHPHNALLDAWLSLGILGAVLLAIAIAALMMHGLAMRRGDARGNLWQVGAIAALAGGLAHGLVDNVYFLPDLAVLTWVLVAVAESRHTDEQFPLGDRADGEVRMTPAGLEKHLG